MECEDRGGGENTQASNGNLKHCGIDLRLDVKIACSTTSQAGNFRKAIRDPPRHDAQQHLSLHLFGVAKKVCRN